MCGGVDTVVQNTAGNQVRSNKFPIFTYYGSTPQQPANTNNRTVFVENEIPSNPIILNAEYAGTQAEPNANFFFMVGLTIYEFEGDLPASIF